MPDERSGLVPNTQASLNAPGGGIKIVLIWVFLFKDARYETHSSAPLDFDSPLAQVTGIFRSDYGSGRYYDCPVYVHRLSFHLSHGFQGTPLVTSVFIVLLYRIEKARLTISRAFS